MTKLMKPDVLLGLLVLALSLVVVFIWVPLDVETGIFEKVRRRTTIGDSFAPVLAASVLGLGALLLVQEGWSGESKIRLSSHSCIYALTLLVMFVVSLTAMRWAGPVALSLLGAGEADYRTLRETAPWKYIGFVLGGAFMVTSTISTIERRLTLRAVLVGLAATLLLIAVYDLPFDDLLLPPNGDV